MATVSDWISTYESEGTAALAAAMQGGLAGYDLAVAYVALVAWGRGWSEDQVAAAEGWVALSGTIADLAALVAASGYEGSAELAEALAGLAGAEEPESIVDAVVAVVDDAASVASDAISATEAVLTATVDAAGTAASEAASAAGTVYAVAGVAAAGGLLIYLFGPVVLAGLRRR